MSGDVSIQTIGPVSSLFGALVDGELPCHRLYATRMFAIHNSIHVTVDAYKLDYINCDTANKNTGNIFILGEC